MGTYVIGNRGSQEADLLKTTVDAKDYMLSDFFRIVSQGSLFHIVGIPL